MRLRLLALAGLLTAFLVAVGTATADSGTFSGSITPTDCGPLQPVTVAPGDTTIVGMAAMTVSANDITLSLTQPLLRGAGTDVNLADVRVARTGWESGRRRQRYFL